MGSIYTVTNFSFSCFKLFFWNKIADNHVILQFTWTISIRNHPPAKVEDSIIKYFYKVLKLARGTT